MSTWIVEYQVRGGHSILEYCGTLHLAKSLYESNLAAYPTVSILKLTGDRFGEGYHQYRMVKVNGRWSKQRPSYKF